MAISDYRNLKIYNSLTRQKEAFTPINDGYVGMYVCGPTVYSNVHLGNVRTFLSFDMVYRYFKHLDYKVRYVRNITDAGHLENDADEGEDRNAASSADLEEFAGLGFYAFAGVNDHDHRIHSREYAVGVFREIFVPRCV